jgi:hypothetical protein
MNPFARPKPQYDPNDEAKFRDALATAMQKMFQRGESIEMWPGTSVFMRSPNGARWQITVSNAGAIVVTAA